MRTVGRFVALALVACVASGCLLPPTPWVSPAGTAVARVGVIGDSLVYQAQHDTAGDDLTQALVDADYAASVDATIGAKTADLPKFPPFDEPGPDIEVIALGTNDAHDGVVPTADSIANIEQYLGSTQETQVRCFALVTVAEVPAWQLDVYGPPLNAGLRNIAAARDDVVIGSWDALVREHPEYLKPNEVHHTEAGRSAYRQLIVDAANACAAKLSGTATTTEPPSTEAPPPEVGG